MVFQELLIFPKGPLKIVNGVFVAGALVCIVVFQKLDAKKQIKGGTRGVVGYYELWIAILCIALFLCALMACFVALANSNQYNIPIAVFYLLVTILISVGNGFACRALIELNLDIAANIIVPGYGEFVAAIVFSFFAGITHFACAILHLVYRKNVIYPIDNFPDEELTIKSSTF